MPAGSHEALLVCFKIIAMFLVMSVGYFCRRRGLLDTPTTSALSGICTEITLPALIFMQMVETVDFATLRVGWTIPLLAVAGTTLGFVLGACTWRLFATRSQAPVFIFSSGISNWIYLPLPIVDALYGKEGMQTLFLCNLGIQFLFWTLGVAILHGGHLDQRSLRNLITNPGLIATFIGIAFAVVPGFLGVDPAAAPAPLRSSAGVLADGLKLLGQATIPVSLLITGAQIAAATMVQNRPAKALAGILLNRLFLAPVLCILMLYVFARSFPVLPDHTLLIIAIILLMPVSVTSTVLSEKMNQDTSFAAQSVLYSTLASILTVPLLVSARPHYPDALKLLARVREFGYLRGRHDRCKY